MKRKFILAFVFLILIASVCVWIIVHRFVTYRRLTIGATITTSGIIKTGVYDLNIYESDGVTPLTEINWSVIVPTEWKHYDVAINCPDAVTQTVVISWTDDSPDYLTHESYREFSPGQWYQWPKDSLMEFPKTGWLNVEFTLTAVMGAPEGAFHFDITLTTA